MHEASTININLLISILLSFVAFATFINHRFLKVPSAIGIMVISAVTAILLKTLYTYNVLSFNALIFIEQVDFKSLLLEGVLGYLLFASAVHVDVTSLKKWWKQISLLATVGVFVSSFFIGYLSHFFFSLIGYDIPFLICLLFGALISPTDPIAALAILNSIKTPEEIKIKLTGESLFNDGSGIVMFIAVLGLIATGNEISVSQFSQDFIVEVSGAVSIGLIVGAIFTWLISSTKDFSVLSILSLSAASISYLLASHFHFSAPISTVIAGLFVGIKNKTLLEENLKNSFDDFWKIIDTLLNSLLFALIGLEVVLIDFSWTLLMLGFVAFIMVMIGRYLSVVASLLWFKNNIKQGTVPLLTWGGIRGGISLALALSIPHTNPYYQFILGITFIAVLLSGVFQGLTLKYIVQFYSGERKDSWISKFDVIAYLKRRQIIKAKTAEVLTSINVSDTEENKETVKQVKEKVQEQVAQMDVNSIEIVSDAVSKNIQEEKVVKTEELQTEVKNDNKVINSEHIQNAVEAVMSEKTEKETDKESEDKF